MKWCAFILLCSAVAYASDDSLASPAPKLIRRILQRAPAGTASTSVEDPFAGNASRTSSSKIAGKQGAGGGIVFTCDSSIDTLGPAGTCAYLNSTIAGIYSTTFTNANASIYIMYTFGLTGLAASGQYFASTSYSNYRTALINAMGPGTVRADAIASLPATEPSLYQGSAVTLTGATYEALGFSPVPGTNMDQGPCTVGKPNCYNGVIAVAAPSTLGSTQGFWYRSLSSGPQPADDYDFFSVVEHETDELLGTISCVETTEPLSDNCGTDTPAAVDLFRYNNDNGMAATPYRVLIDTTPGAYFSYTSGANNGADGAVYNTLPNGEDYGDFASKCEHVQDAVGCQGMSFDITNDGGPEINILDAVGFNLQVRASPEVGPVSPSPATGAGPITFTATFVSENGNNYEDMLYSYMLINSSLSAANACYVLYYQPLNTFYLYNNAGTTSVGSIVAGTAGTISNGQCTLNGATSSASGSGNGLTVTVQLTAQTGWLGTKNVYLLAEDGQNNISGWQNEGTWTPGADTPPTVGTLTANPSPANQPTEIFTVTESTQNGKPSSDLTWSYFLINTSITAANACYVRYYQPTNSFYLDTNDGTRVLGPLVAGSNGVLSNGQCTLNGTGSGPVTPVTTTAASAGRTSAIGNAGNTLSLNISVTAMPAFTGTKNIYVLAEDSEGSVSGWHNLGSWTP